MNIKIEKLKEILEIGLKGNDFSEIYYEKKNQNQITLDDEKITNLNTGTDEGAGIRIIKEGKTIFGYTNDVTYEGLKKLVEKLNIKNIQKEFKKITLDYKLQEAPMMFKKDIAEEKIEKKIKLLKNGNKVGREITKKEVIQFTGRYSDVSKNTIILNSEGKYTKEKLNRSVLSFTTILKEGKEIQTGYESKGTTEGFEFFENGIEVKIAKEAVRIAETMLKAEAPISGKMDVIIAGKAGGTMIHEACGHGLELDLVQDDISIYRGLKNKKVANEKVTVIDSGVEASFFGTTYFDDEGNKTEKSILIENGILKKYMNNRVTAKKEKVDFTGNGRRESYKHIPIPRMRNTYIEAGNDSLEEMLMDIKKGIYVTKMGGGQVDTVTGDFIFSAMEAYIIQNGEIKNPIRNVSLIGNGKDVLKNIVAVGNDIGFTLGMCGKGGQGMPVTSGQPTIKIKEMTVGGTE